MPKMILRRGKASGKRAQLAFAGTVAAVVAVTLGIAGKGLFPGASDSAQDEAGKGGKAISAPKPIQPVSPGKGTSAPQPDEAALKKAAQQSAARFHVKRVLPIKGPFRHGEYVWDDAGVPDGPVVITIDLKAQTLSVFRDGYEIGAAVILYGATDKPSPLGVYPILEKDADHVSRTYDNAPMPYSLRLTNDWVAIHGSDVEWGNATHGCIGVPTAFAKKLFGVTKIGDIAIITDGKMMDIG